MEKEPLKIFRAKQDQKFECCKCGWKGTIEDSADKTPVVNSLYLLVCPKCGNKDEFFKFEENEL